MSEETPKLGREAPPINPGSEAWLLLKSYFNTRIDELHSDLESPAADVAMTRGRIAEIRDLFRLMEPRAPIPGTSSTY